MPDQQETEIKFIVPEPDALRESLVRLGAAAEGRHFEDNIRLDDPQNSLRARKFVLRLRRIERGGQVEHRLTVKTPGTSDDVFKTRREIELAVSDGPAMLAALSVLGYEPTFRYEKRREVFTLNGVEADLDEMPFGWFLELEGAAEGIRALAAKLQLDLGEGLSLSYAQIFENVRTSMKLAMPDLTFATFEGITVNPRHYRANH
jgi:adenylate cyclase class 2